jgi:sulfonate transport system substrate-binding protein
VQAEPDERLYFDGTVVKRLQQAGDFFMNDAGVTNPTPARDYFDPALYLGTIA